MSTVLSLPPMTLMKSKTARIRALLPVTSVFDRSCWDAFMAVSSSKAQLLEIGNVSTERRLDAEEQRHMGAGAVRAHSEQSDTHAVAVDFNQLDVAPVRVEERADPL